MRNGEWRMGNGEWEIENMKLIFFFYINGYYRYPRLFFATFCARIKGYDKGRSHPVLFLYFTTCVIGRLVGSFSENCDRGLENTALALRPRIAFSSLRST